MDLLEELKSQQELMIKTRHDLHRIAELSMKEYKTTEYIKNALVEMGAEIADVDLETGVCALIRGGKPGPTIGFRADIDALPIKEESGLEFCSEQEGVCHACGHDMHAAILLSAARWLCSHKDELAGNVRLFFQPGEETLAGARAMIEAGCMQLDPAPEAMLAFHTYPPYMAGTFGIINGPATQSCDNIRITIKSMGGHGAYPHLCADPVISAAEVLVQLQTAISRRNNSMMPAVLTFGSIHGGTAPNIIPKEVVLDGTLRAAYQQSRDVIKKAVKEIAEHVCAAMGTEVEVEFVGSSTAAVVNDSQVVSKAENAIKSLFGEQAAIQMPFPLSGSEDFANYLEHCPGALIRVGTQSPSDPNSALGLHTSKIHFDEQSIYYAAALFCRFALDYLK